MSRNLIIASIFLFMSAYCNAQELWLQPNKFFYTQGENLRVRFYVGENFRGHTSDLKKENVDRLEIHQINTMADLKANEKDDKNENFSVALPNEGTQLVIMQSKILHRENSAEQFNIYLKDNGLDETINMREQSNTSSKPGKENYAYYDKLMVQVGDKRDDTFSKVIGLPLEIIPIVNPYEMKVGDMVKFQILFEGKPLFGVKVKIWSRADNRTIIQPVYTLQDGTVEARISNKGMWMVSVVKMVSVKDTSAKWQTYCGSLTFGVK